MQVVLVQENGWVRILEASTGALAEQQRHPDDVSGGHKFRQRS